ncbi:MAG: acetyl-CoA carboxylase biotin carboxyl carrier protein subunit [Chloroflexi bacterium]|nr:MAG: acetyl-CoA carboxylase biotin carboxyl carrier protein subunit [Chloroflexota bacterium]
MGGPLGENAQMRYITTIEGKQFLIEIIDEKHINVDGKVYQVDFESVSGQPVYSLIVDGKSHEGYAAQGEDHWQVLLRGRLYPITVEDEREKRLRRAAGGGVAETGEYHLRAPMPGLIVTIPVEEGQAVKRGQVLLILESMKMQNELKAPRDGTVGRLRVKAGETVEQKQTLLSVM